MSTATTTTRRTQVQIVDDLDYNAPYKIRLLAAFADAGKTGLTAEEAGEAASLMYVGYWKRVSDLADYYGNNGSPLIKGKTTSVQRDNGWGSTYTSSQPVTRIGSSGRQQKVYAITEAGKAALRAFKSDAKKAA